MKLRIAVVVLALACLGVYVATVQTPPASSPEARIIRPVPSVPAELAALAGIWEGLRPDAFPSRLLVYDVHEDWAAILFTWGNHPDATYGGGSLHARAKVLPGGKLFWRHMGGITFQLSEDWTTLVVCQEVGGREAVGLMRRVLPEGEPAMLAQGGID
ncbi:MAG TPA: hypothetical protein VLT62_22400 [Candidatus Methylomirabilis sp.]|nr:hypothetical protein [Candidatus Methylomirabilis sp.]